MEDRRRHPRYPYDGSVTYRRLGPSTSGRIQNLSEGGLMVELPEPFALGTPLDLVISLGDHSIHAEGEVVWSQSPSDSTPPSYPHGVKFTRLELPDRLTLAVFIAKVFGG